MGKATIDKIDYLIAVITEFAEAHGIDTQKAYAYLQDYKGIDFVDEYYDVEHTMSFENVVEDLTEYCKRMGGKMA